MNFNVVSMKPFKGLKKTEGSAGRILLLQGPVGPFFKKLQSFFAKQNYDTWRVSFNPADTIFSSKKKRINFSGSYEEWENWLKDFLSVAEFDHLILFGSERPLHRIARKIASEIGVNVICLEEGYLRPGYISVEHSGNNADSPIAGCLPPKTYKVQQKNTIKKFKSFPFKGIYALIYYTIRNIFSLTSQRELFHKKFPLISEAFYWSRNFYRRYKQKRSNALLIQDLYENHKGRYFFVPLQVASDSQLGSAAYGWNSARLISSVLTSFAAQAPLGTRLIFKIHPLELGHNNSKELIYQTAEALNIRNRIDIIDVGPMGLLTKSAAGMITINSTSGLSAIAHGIPLLVVGDAFYAHNDLATCAHGKPDYDKFWNNKFVASADLRQNYLEWLKHVSLKSGDFYAPKGIEIACEGILEKVKSTKELKLEERIYCEK